MSSANIKFQMHLTVKLLENVFHPHQSPGLFNSHSNKVIQINSFFYNVLFRQLSFPTVIGNYIKSQSNFVFIQRNITCEKQLL